MTSNPFRYFKTSCEVIQLAVMMHVLFPKTDKVPYEKSSYCQSLRDDDDDR